MLLLALGLYPLTAWGYDDCVERAASVYECAGSGLVGGVVSGTLPYVVGVWLVFAVLFSALWLIGRRPS